MNDDLLPSEHERQWLLDQLAALLRQRGPERLLCAPLLTPSDRFFPDQWSPDVRGVRILAKRLLRHAGLANLDAAVALYVQDEDVNPLERFGLATTRTHAGAAAWYAGTHEGVSYFAADVKQLADPVAIVGVLCHEVAHAWRDYQKLAGDDRAIEEQLTDLTTVYLGFGILSANVSYRYRSAAKEWSHHQTGYLPVESMCFLLATQAMICGIPPKKLAGWLETTQRASFLRAYDAVDFEELLVQLGLPPPDDWPPVRELVVDPID